MTYLPQNSITSYLPNDVIIPEDAEELRQVLDDTFRRVIDAVNDKDIGHYNTVACVNGQKWFDGNNTQAFKNVFRKVVDFGALPNAAAKSVAHGITTNVNTRFTRIYGCATDPAGATINVTIPIPYVDPTALANCIGLYVDATNIVITTAADYTAFITCYVVVEYLQH